LSIGNPAFTRKEYPELADLPAAAQEAEAIAGLYDSAKIFVGEEAVKEQVIGNLNNADVVHFAGHYVPNSASPSLSKLLLAAGDLPVQEITQNNLPRVRLMILSACETGTEKFYNGEGMIGAARAFLAADVPLVVASQWSVESESTAELMIKFHRYRKTQNLTTIESLRRAQVDLLTDKNSPFHQPFYWAGFLPIGGYASY
jgi:CHAT domain-containing protein